MVVREIAPGRAVIAVVLADRAPLALAQVGAPGLPGDTPVAAGGEARVLRGHHSMYLRRRNKLRGGMPTMLAASLLRVKEHNLLVTGNLLAVGNCPQLAFDP